MCLRVTGLHQKAALLQCLEEAQTFLTQLIALATYYLACFRLYNDTDLMLHCKQNVYLLRGLAHLEDMSRFPGTG